MFLEDRIVAIAEAVDLNNLTKDVIIKVIGDMFQEAQKELIACSGSDNQTIIATAKRNNKIWNMAMERLEKQGRDFAERDGYKKGLWMIECLRPICKAAFPDFSPLD